jgi:hypothetical protein
MLATLEQIQRDLPEGTRKAVNEMFTAKVIVGGEEQILSGAELVAYLVSEVDSAKRSAGSAVKDAEAAKQALGRAEAATSRAEETVGIARELVITIQGEFSGVQSSVAAAFEAVDKKIAALMMLVTSGRELTPQEAEHAQTILEPSYKPANAGEVKG